MPKERVIAWTNPPPKSNFDDEHSPITREEISEVLRAITEFKCLPPDKKGKQVRNLPASEIADLTQRLLVDARLLEFDGEELIDSIDKSLAKSVA